MTLCIALKPVYETLCKFCVLGTYVVYRYSPTDIQSPYGYGIWRSFLQVVPTD